MTIRGPWAIILVALLFISLAVNFLGIGFAAARYTLLRQSPTLERVVAAGVRSFPPEIRRSLLREALAERGPLRGALRDFVAARQKMFAALKADPYDAAAVEAAFAEVRDKTTALQKIGQVLLARTVSAAPADVRARITAPQGGLR